MRLHREKQGQTAPIRTRSRTKLGQYLSVAEASKKLGVSTKTVTRWCELGTLAAIEKPSGNKTTYEIHPKSVDMVLTQMREDAQEAVKAKRECKSHSSYIDSWKRAMAKGILTGKPYSQATIDDYIQHINYYFKRNKGIYIDGLKAELAKIPVNSVAKRQHFYKAVRCLAKYLIREGALEPSFIDEVKPLSQKRHIPPKRLAITADEVQRLINVCESLDDRALITILANTGLKASEFCNLQMSDIDLQNQFLIVRLGKGGKTRQVDLKKGPSH